MGNYSVSKKGICPLYKDETGSMIRCESNPMVPVSTVHFAFGTRQACKDYKNKYCYAKYEDCKIFCSFNMAK